MCLFVALLLASPAYAGGMTEANELISQAAAIQKATNTLDGQLAAQVRGVSAIDPTSAAAADALPMIAQASTTLAEMNKNMEAISSLWGEVAALDVRDEVKTYAVQQQDIAKTQLQIWAVTGRILADLQTLYDRNELSALDQAGLKRLDREFADLPAKSKALRAKIADMQQTSHQYYVDHRLDRPAWRAPSLTRWIITLVVATSVAIACGILARLKNRNVVGWGVFGFFIPIAALIAILVVRKIELEPRSAPLLQPRL